MVARRGPTTIVRTRHGLTLAAAGVDASNVDAGQPVLLLPLDPDGASARRAAGDRHERTGANVGVVVTDTAGRAWREGQTDIAIGAAGITVLDDHAGRVDRLRQRADGHRARRWPTSSPARPSWPRASSAARPFAVVRGSGRPRAAARRRRSRRRGAGPAPRARTCSGSAPARPCVRALRRRPADQVPFGAPAGAEELAAAAVPGPRRRGRAAPGRLRSAPTDPRLAPLAFAHGWCLEDASPSSSERAVVRPVDSVDSCVGALASHRPCAAQSLSSTASVQSPPTRGAQ